MKKLKIIRATTVPQSLEVFCKDILRELTSKYEVIGLSSPGKDLDEVAEREGVRVIAIPMERHISILKDSKALWRMWGTFRKEKPTMVHSMTPKAGMLCMVAAWLARVPVRVHTFTGLVFPTSTGLKRRILMFTDWLTCACATHIIPEGEGVMNDLRNNGITKKPLKVLGYGNVKGIDIVRFSDREEVKQLAATIRNTAYFTFLFVGRIVRDKGINELCSAFERLSESNKNIRLYLVGRLEENLDPIADSTKAIIEKNPFIYAVGEKYGDDLLAYYKASDCFVFPSYREGFPNTLLEAGAMGLPSIVTNINGSREIILEGVNGTIIPSKDEDALYNAMGRMIDDNNWRDRMAKNARQQIVNRFEQGFVRHCLYDFYESVLES